MKYVTINMIRDHAQKKASQTVIAALKAAGIKMEKIPGVRGWRITERDANKFLMLQWPEAGPLPASPDQVTGMALHPVTK
jgi:hypothetical protein